MSTLRWILVWLIVIPTFPIWMPLSLLWGAVMERRWKAWEDEL
jgi:hypothetical protein